MDPDETTNGAAQVQMPQYQSHKKVWALKIKSVTVVNEDGSCSLAFEEEGYAPIRVDGEWVMRHNPQVGGYYVVYPGDGYASWSPAKAFEEGYTKIG
jgi:hypothetical protein